MLTSIKQFIPNINGEKVFNHFKSMKTLMNTFQKAATGGVLWKKVFIEI